VVEKSKGEQWVAPLEELVEAPLKERGKAPLLELLGFLYPIGELWGQEAQLGDEAPL
jgi:hypothetical protein